jgi:hypothetical protein
MCVNKLHRKFTWRGIFLATAIAAMFSNGELPAQETLSVLANSPDLPNTLASNLQDCMSVTKTGAGTLNLITNSNASSGGCVIASGTLSADFHTGTLAAGTLNIGSGRFNSLDITTADTSVPGNIISINATDEIIATGCITFAGDTTFGGLARRYTDSGNTTVDSGTLTFSLHNPSTTISGGTLTLGGNILSGGTLTFGNVGTISGTSTLTIVQNVINSPDPIVLVSGGTVQVGTLAVNSSGALALDCNTLTSGTLTLINQGTLTLGLGAGIVIVPGNGGVLSIRNTGESVPEPSALVLLVTAGLGLVGAAWQRRRA